MYIAHILLILSSHDGHLGYFYILAYVNNSALNMVYLSFLKLKKKIYLMRAAFPAHGGSQAKGLMGVVAILCQSHSNSRSELLYTTAHGNALSLTH